MKRRNRKTNIWSSVSKDRRAKLGIFVVWDYVDERFINIILETHGQTITIIGIYGVNNGAVIAEK